MEKKAAERGLLPRASDEARLQQPSLSRATRMVRWDVPVRNGMVIVRTRVDGMLGAPRSRSAHARRGAGGTVTVAIHTLTGEHDLATGIVACLPSHGSRANWHPHLHLLVTDGGFRPDGLAAAGIAPPR